MKQNKKAKSFAFFYLFRRPVGPPNLINMSGKTGMDYSVVYKNRELRQLQKRLKATKRSLLACSAVILLAAVIFSLMSSVFTFTNITVYILSAIVFTAFAYYSAKKPYHAILWATGFLIILWIADITFGNSEMIFEFNILKLILFAILMFSMKTAREAFIIKKDLHLS